MDSWQIAISSIAIGSLMIGSAIAEATPRYTDTEQQLIEVDKRMQRAFVDKDVTVLDAILTDDYMLVLSDGTERSKSDVLKNAASPTSTWEINETDGWEVKVHGAVAVVVATLHQKGVENGRSFDSKVRFSDTYILESGRWRNVHAHASRAVPVVQRGAGAHVP